jgi:hypothetical protein
MKKALAIFSFVFSVCVPGFAIQHITTDTNIILEAGSDEHFASPDIYISCYWDIGTDQWFVTLMLAPPGTTEIIKEYHLTITEIQFNDQFGTQYPSELSSAMGQAVVEEYLQALNVSTTFAYVT